MKKNTAIYLLSLLLLLPFTGCIEPYGDENIDLGLDLYEQGDLEGAARELTIGLNRELQTYDRAESCTVPGNVYYDMDEYDSAIVYHEKALDLNPQYGDAWVNLGIVYRIIEEYDKAEECYNKAIAIDPEYPELYISLGALYIYQDKPQEAATALEKAIELGPGKAVAHSNYALALATVGRFEEADASLKKAVTLGYENGPSIQARINDLKALAE